LQYAHTNVALTCEPQISTASAAEQIKFPLLLFYRMMLAVQVPCDSQL